MKQFRSALFVFAAFLACLMIAAPGYCYREKPGDVIEDNCTGVDNATRILITYDTKHGATATVAKMIFDTICDNASGAASVDLIFVENLDPDTIQNYDAIIIGSPIYIGKWLPGVKKLLRTQHEEIAKIKSAFFITCTYIKEDGDVPPVADVVEMYMDPVLSKYTDIQPETLGILAGQFTFDELYPFERFLMKLAHFEEGDFIVDAKVEAWAKEAWNAVK